MWIENFNLTLPDGITNRILKKIIFNLLLGIPSIRPNIKAWAHQTVLYMLSLLLFIISLTILVISPFPGPTHQSLKREKHGNIYIFWPNSYKVYQNFDRVFYIPGGSKLSTSYLYTSIIQDDDTNEFQ